MNKVFTFIVAWIVLFLFLSFGLFPYIGYLMGAHGSYIGIGAFVSFWISLFTAFDADDDDINYG